MTAGIETRGLTRDYQVRRQRPGLTGALTVGIAAVALTVVFVVLTRLHWWLALRRHASASS